MDFSLTGLVFNWLPNLPGILTTAAFAFGGRSSNSDHQDALTETIVASARPILRVPTALLKSQIHCNADRGVWGRMWISKYTVPKPIETAIPPTSTEGDNKVLDVREAVSFAIRELNQHEDAPIVGIPDLVEVETEWTGYRSNAYPFSPRPNISEREMFGRMMEETDPDGPTVIYMHGGAHCLMDPCTHRLPTSSLAQQTHGRVLSIRYRLSPQHPFPAALLDIFTVYLALVSPPPHAYHTPVPPSKIVLAGDSSGAGLAASLQLLLLTLSRNHVSVSYNSQVITLASPPTAGLSLISPWLDSSRSLPSTTKNTKWDIIAPPPLDAASPPFPPDSIWPTTPPRADTYVPNARLTTHPLISPLAAKPHHWHGTSPVYVCTGWEVFSDEIQVFARRVYQSGPEAIVVFDGWQGMPHCFSLFPWNEAGRRANATWTDFVRKCVDTDANADNNHISVGSSTAGSAITTETNITSTTTTVSDTTHGNPITNAQKNQLSRTETGTWSSSTNLTSIRRVNLNDLGLERDGVGYHRDIPLDDETVDRMMEDSRLWRIQLEEKLLLLEGGE